MAAILSSRPPLVWTAHPDADASLAQFALHIEACQRCDQPAFEVADKGAHIGIAALQVEHDIGHALPRPVIGVLAAAPGPEHRETLWRQQVLFVRARPGRVERGMFEQPDEFARAPLGDGGGARLHLRDSSLVRYGRIRHAPFGRRLQIRFRRSGKARLLNHRVTLACDACDKLKGVGQLGAPGEFRQ